LDYWFIGWPWSGGAWSTGRFYRLKLVVSDGILTTELASFLRSWPGSDAWRRSYGKVKSVRIVGATGVLAKRTVVEIDGETARSRFALGRDDAERFAALFEQPPTASE
jgi:hypothetical protein